MINPSTLLRLLQLVSPALPVGAYSYSEGLEFLVQSHQVHDAESLNHWLLQELQYGAVRLEAAVLVRAYRAAETQSLDNLLYWNRWLSAARETEELRSQSWQMGRSLLRLFQDLQPDNLEPSWIAALQAEGTNFAIGFAIVAAEWQIDLPTAVLGYLYSWATNLVGAGVKLIPLGQTAGQKQLLQLQPILEHATNTILTLADDDLTSCGWGLALASMAHETQYSRLFRS